MLAAQADLGQDYILSLKIDFVNWAPRQHLWARLKTGLRPEKIDPEFLKIKTPKIPTNILQDLGPPRRAQP